MVSRRTFCDNTSSQASGALGSSTYPICTRDIDHPWPKVTAVDMNGVTTSRLQEERGRLTKYSEVLPDASLTPPLNIMVEDEDCV